MALVIVTRRGVGVSADRHAVALVLFKLLFHLAFSFVSRRVSNDAGETRLKIGNVHGWVCLHRCICINHPEEGDRGEEAR